MLDTETKRRIDTARDILVGKVPDPKSQVEQITIALIYKFMDDMDLQSEELGGERSFFKGEFEKYAWRKIFDPRMGGFEILNLYSEAIMKMDVNPNIPQLFRDIFKNAYLPYRDPETLKTFLKVINDFTYDHSERLGDAFEYLLSVLGSQGEAGQFRTPRHIIDFMVAIIDPKKDEVILDPACGTAGFLISSYKHIIKTNSTNYNPKADTRMFETKDLSLSEIVINSKNYTGDKLTPDERSRLANNIKGYDISPDMVRLSLVNMYLHGLHAPHIYEYDTLTSEDNWNEYGDVILANPPFMSPKGGIRPHKRFLITSSRSEVLFVDYIAEHLTPNGRAAVIVPEGIIFQSGTAYKNLRKMLVENYLVGVISLPAGVFNPYSGVKTSILWLDRTLAKKTDKILFVKIKNDGFDLGAQRRPIKLNDLPSVFQNVYEYKIKIVLNKLFDYETTSNINLVSIDEISKSGEYNLSGERYKAGIVYSTKNKFATIGELCDIFNGSRPKGGAVTEGVLSIGGEHINYNGSFNLENPRYIPIEYFKNLGKGKLEFNDVLIVKDGATTGKMGFFDSRSPFKVAAVNEHVFIFRKKSTEILPYYLYQILRSENGKNEILKFKVGAAVGGINLNIKNLKIPLPPISIQEEIVAEIESYQKIIDGARQVVENYKPRIDIDPEWEMVELGELCELTYGYTDTALNEGEIRFIRITDISEKGELRDEDVKFIKTNSEACKCLIKKGDLVVARTGATYGKTLYYNNNEPAVYASYLIKLDFDKSRVEPLYYWIFTLSDDYDQQKSKLMTGGGQPQFNAGAIKRIIIPLPPLNIQKNIIEHYQVENQMIKSSAKLIEIFKQKIRDRIAKVWGK